MPRWAMVIDLEKCIGCGTCVAVCEKFNNVPPNNKWRKLVNRSVQYDKSIYQLFLTMCCNHCSNPPCLEVCPSGATYRREDGIVDIDYKLCLGCGACIMACPYDARSIARQDSFFIEDDVEFDKSFDSEEDRIGICTKCNFCRQRLDEGISKGFMPGQDIEATPACVRFCIAGALYFGDISNPESEVAKFIREKKALRLQEDLGTDSAVYYILGEKLLEVEESGGC